VNPPTPSEKGTVEKIANMKGMDIEKCDEED